MSSKQRAQDLVTGVLDNDALEFHARFNAIVGTMAAAAERGDAELGQLRTFLTPAGADTDAYRGGVGQYFRVMAETGNHRRALRAAAQFAGLETPPEDTGPVDKIANRVHAALDNGGNAGGVRGAIRSLTERRH